MLSVEKPKLAQGSSPEIKKLHALLCQAQVDLIQMQAFAKNKNMFMRATRDFGMIFPELLKCHAKCLEIYQTTNGPVLFSTKDEPQYSSQEFIRYVLKTLFNSQ